MLNPIIALFSCPTILALELALTKCTYLLLTITPKAVFFIDIHRHKQKKWQISVSKKIPQVDFFSKTSQFSTFLSDKKGQFVAQNRQVTRECVFKDFIFLDGKISREESLTG